MNAENLVQRAKAEADRRNYDGAIVYYQQALTIDPAHRAARRGAREAALAKYERGYPGGMTRFLVGFGPRMGLAFSGKEPGRKMEAMEKVLATDPRNAALGMRLGAVAEKAGIFTAAAGAYEGVLLGNPEHAEAMKALGRSLQRLGEIEEALEVLERAIAVAPRDQEAQRLRKDLAAEGYAKSSGFATARSTHDLLKDKDQARKLEKQQQIVRGEDDMVDRIAEAKQAVAAAPDDAQALAELARAQSEARRYEEALATITKALALAPDDGALRMRRGDIRIAQADRREQDARQSGDAAGLAAAEKERLAILVEEYRDRVRTHPTDVGMRHALAGYLERTGEFDAAIAEFQQSVKDPRRRADALGGLGRCFLGKEMFDLAAKQLEKALEETGSNAERRKDLLYDLATVKERQGDTAAAKTCLSEIYEVDINYRDVAARIEGLG